MTERRDDAQPRRALLRAGALGLALLASACVAPRRPGPVAPPPPPVRAPDAVPVSPLPADAERNRVALLVPVTGANAGVGQSIANAANLALLDAGGKGIRITTYDTAGGAAAAAQRAIAEGNRLILGPLLAEDVRAAAAVAQGARVPVIAFSNDSAAAQPGVYLLGYQPTDSIERVVGYAASRGLRRFAGLIPAGVYGRRASGAFLRAVSEAKGNVVSIADYDRSPASITAAVRKVQAAGGYDALLIADSSRVVLQAAPLAKRGAGASARLLGTELWNTETSLNAAPAAAGAWFASVSDGLYGQFAARYRARFGRGPYRLASLGYDAVLLTMRVGANWRVGSAFPERQLADADGFSGVDGAFRFGRDGIAERALEVKQVGSGGFTTVAPAPRGFAGR